MRPYFMIHVFFVIQHPLFNLPVISTICDIVRGGLDKVAGKLRAQEAGKLIL